MIPVIFMINMIKTSLTTAPITAIIPIKKNHSSHRWLFAFNKTPLLF